VHDVRVAGSPVDDLGQLLADLDLLVSVKDSGHRDEQAETVTAFTARALAFYASLGITARRLQTDNAWAYVKNRSLRELLTEHDIKHRRIPPRTPKRTGKVQRYQQTLAREWAYGQRYRDSDSRAAALPIWLTHYNYNRNHSSLQNRPPITRVRNDPRHTARS
jgi:transposase InsO family protein